MFIGTYFGSHIFVHIAFVEAPCSERGIYDCDDDDNTDDHDYGGGEGFDNDGDYFIKTHALSPSRDLMHRTLK